jgi:3-O-methylgallate 3,4-dioxygenase
VNDELRSGASEVRNWVTVGGALSGTDLTARVVDYLPGYRSEAGTGCAVAFMAWQP